jgi:hypothetical protein
MIRALERSFLARLLTSTLALSALIVVALTSMFLWTYGRDLERQLSRRAEALAEFIAGQSNFPMLVGDRAELERIAASAVATEEVLFVELTDALSSQPVYLSRPGFRPNSGSYLEVAHEVARPAQMGRLEWEPGTGVPERLGKVRLGFSTAREQVARRRVAWLTLLWRS